MDYDVKKIDLELERYLEKMRQAVLSSFEQRLAFITQEFIGRPYLRGACGEGPLGVVDQNPLYRFDVFDCLTYVNIALALAAANTIAEFQTIIRTINYYQGKIAYESRYHFMSVDWNIQNQKRGIISDYTTHIKNSNSKPLYKIARAWINRPQWFQRQALHDLSTTVKAECAHTAYLPLKCLNEGVLQQIPSPSLIEIVRPNWDLCQKIGTHLNISHLGFAFRIDNQLYFRHAALEKTVLEVPLAEYIQNCFAIPTIGGINIQLINSQKDWLFDR